MEPSKMNSDAVSDLVRKYFSAYESKDRVALEALLSADFTFSSPLDDQIQRKVYFERCWPNSENIRRCTIEKLFEQGKEAFVTYEIEPKSGVKFRNTEHFKCEGGKVREVNVYFGSLPARASPDIDEAQIRKLVDARVRAVREKDVDEAMSTVAPDVLSFDVVNPLQNVGADASRKRARAWFSSFQGPLGCELRDLSIAVGGDVAFSHSLNRYSGTKSDGEKIDMWVRATACYRKINGKWLLTHEHSSVPFDAETGKASLAIKP